MKNLKKKRVKTDKDAEGSSSTLPVAPEAEVRAPASETTKSAFAPVTAAYKAPDDLRQRLIQNPPLQKSCYNDLNWCQQPIPMNPFAQIFSLPHTLLQQLTTASQMRQIQGTNGGFTQTDFVPPLPQRT